MGIFCPKLLGFLPPFPLQVPKPQTSSTPKGFLIPQGAAHTLLAPEQIGSGPPTPNPERRHEEGSGDTKARAPGGDWGRPRNLEASGSAPSLIPRLIQTLLRPPQSVAPGLPSPYQPQNTSWHVGELPPSGIKWDFSSPGLHKGQQRTPEAPQAAPKQGEGVQARGRPR